MKGIREGGGLALLAWTGEGPSHIVCESPCCACKLGQVFPEKFAAVEDFSAAHVKQVHGQHPVFVVIAEDVGVVAFGGGDALLLLQLLDGGDQVAIAGGALELLRLGGFRHALAQRFDQVGLAAFEEKLHVAHGFAVDLGRGQVLHARTQAALDVVLEAGARVVAR